MPNLITDDTIEIGEATLATVGLTAVLKDEMPRVGIGLQNKITNINKTIDSLARGSVADDLPGKISVPRPFVYSKLLDRFTRPLSEGEIKKITDMFPHDAQDTALSFISTLQSTFVHLSDKLPVSTYETYLGPKRIMPTSDKMYNFWVEYWILDQPFVTFKLMQRGALTPANVVTLQQFYPSLYNYMVKSTLDALIARNLREPSFTSLPPRADRGLATLKGQRVIEYGVNNHVVPPTKPSVSDAQPPKLNKGLQTIGQRADAL